MQINQKKRVEAMTIRSSSQIKAYNSKTIFNKLSKPWMVVSWMEKDFAKETFIELRKLITSSKDQKMN